MDTFTRLPTHLVRRNSFASCAHGSGLIPRRSLPIFGARMELMVTRRSAPVSESAMTIESPEATSTTVPRKFFPMSELGFGGGAT